MYNSMNSILDNGSIVKQACKVIQFYKLSRLTLQIVNIPVQGEADCGLLWLLQWQKSIYSC